MKLVNAKIHGMIDYTVVIFLWVSPLVFGLSGATELLIYALGGVHLALTMLTNFKLGLIKVIPLQVHGWIEFIVGIVLMASPLLMGDSNFANHYFLAFFGCAVLLTWLMTDYDQH